MSGDQLRNSAVLGNLPSVRALLTGGANPCSADDSGLTALHYAVWNGHLPIVEVLVANCIGTDVLTGEKIDSMECFSDSGLTALHLSASLRSYDILRFLILAGCNLTVEDNQNRTVYDIALDKVEGSKKCALFLSDMIPPSDEEVLIFFNANKEKHYCQLTKSFNLESCPIDPKTGKPIIMREDKLSTPVELTMPEHHIYPFAIKNFESGRGGKQGKLAIRNLKKMVCESGNNEQRRQFLANSIEYNLRKQGLMN